MRQTYKASKQWQNSLHRRGKEKLITSKIMSNASHNPSVHLQNHNPSVHLQKGWRDAWWQESRGIVCTD
jgi:hypothetical protein